MFQNATRKKKTAMMAACLLSLAQDSDGATFSPDPPRAALFRTRDRDSKENQKDDNETCKFSRV